MIIHVLAILGIIFSLSTEVDNVFAGILKNEPIVLVDTCSVPISGDWIVNSDCTLVLSKTAPDNVWIQNNSVLTISSEVALTISSGNSLTIESGSEVYIKSGGTLNVHS